MSRKPLEAAPLPEVTPPLPSEGGCFVIDANGALQKVADETAPPPVIAPETEA
jgi:hypothetical protein